MRQPLARLHSVACAISSGDESVAAEPDRSTPEADEPVELLCVPAVLNQEERTSIGFPMHDRRRDRRADGRVLRMLGFIDQAERVAAGEIACAHARLYLVRVGAKLRPGEEPRRVDGARTQEQMTSAVPAGATV